MKAIHVGAVGRKRFTLPPDFVTETAAILARRGGGKTYTGNVVAEGLLECGHQVVVIDPLNAWWGLRSSADGKRPGYPIVIFGGSRGDLPLDKGMGEGIADLVAENPSFSCVLSLRHLSKGAQKRFVTAFASRLFDRKGDEKLATAVHIFMDEADIFCPQQVMAREAEMVGAIDDLVRRGRQSGIGVTMITQRSAALNKNVLSQAELLIAGQITGSHDKKAILSWIIDNADQSKQKEFMASLAKLQIGQFWFWSPRWLEVLAQVDVRKRNTFDSSATPKAGKRRRVPKKVRKVDLAEIKKTLQSAIEVAESTDPKALRRKVAELEAALKRKMVMKVSLPMPAPAVQGMTEEQVRKVVDAAVIDRDRQWTDVNDEFLRGLDERLLSMVKQAGDLKIDPPARKDTSTKKFEFAKGSTVVKAPNELMPALSGGKIPRCARAILSVLLSRNRAVSSRLIALQSGYSIKSSGFKNALSSLRTRGWISGGGEAVELTIEGAEEFRRVGGEGASVIDPAYWSSKLHKCERSIFERLVACRCSRTKEELAAETGYSVTSSGFKNALSKLRGLQLIEGKPDIKLVDELFR